MASRTAAAYAALFTSLTHTSTLCALTSSLLSKCSARFSLPHGAPPVFHEINYSPSFTKLLSVLFLSCYIRVVPLSSNTLKNELKVYHRSLCRVIFGCFSSTTILAAPGVAFSLLEIILNHHAFSYKLCLPADNLPPVQSKSY